MLAQFSVHFIFIYISTLIPLIYGDCITDADQCFDKFKSDLENQMKHKSDTPQSRLSEICNPADGSFTQFVNCITEVKTECHSDKRFQSYLCDKKTRILKTGITKYTWKATFFYQLCHNTNTEWSKDFLQHEECINNVLSSPKWKCDISYERVLKRKTDWKTDLNTTCSLWQKYRDCSKRDISLKCGTDASLIADQLFHSHQSYFEKYYSCNFESGKFNDQCWYDSITASPITQTSVSSTTHPTNDMTDNNIDSKKSSDLMNTNDNLSPTQTSDTNQNLQTLKDTTDSRVEENHEEWEKSDLNQSKSSDLIGHESNEMINTDASERHELKVNEMKESNGKSTELLRAEVQVGSEATTDSKADKYLLLIPVSILIMFKKLT